MENRIAIIVKLSNRQSHTISVDCTWSIGELKAILEPVIGIERNCQQVVFRRQVLQDDDTVSSVGIEEGHSVFIAEGPPLSEMEVIRDNLLEYCDLVGACVSADCKRDLDTVKGLLNHVRLSVVVIGEVNNGKSTFVNSFVGFSATSASVLPDTVVPTRFTHANECAMPRVVVPFNDLIRELCVALDGLAAESAAAHSEERANQIRSACDARTSLLHCFSPEQPRYDCPSYEACSELLRCVNKFIRETFPLFPAIVRRDLSKLHVEVFVRFLCPLSGTYDVTLVDCPGLGEQVDTQGNSDVHDLMVEITSFWTMQNHSMTMLIVAADRALVSSHRYTMDILQSSPASMVCVTKVDTPEIRTQLQAILQHMRGVVKERLNRLVPIVTYSGRESLRHAIFIRGLPNGTLPHELNKAKLPQETYDTIIHVMGGLVGFDPNAGAAKHAAVYKKQVSFVQYQFDMMLESSNRHEVLSALREFIEANIIPVAMKNALGRLYELLRQQVGKSRSDVAAQEKSDVELEAIIIDLHAAMQALDRFEPVIVNPAKRVVDEVIPAIIKKLFPDGGDRGADIPAAGVIPPLEAAAHNALHALQEELRACIPESTFSTEQQATDFWRMLRNRLKCLDPAFAAVRALVVDECKKAMYEHAEAVRTQVQQQLNAITAKTDRDFNLRIPDAEFEWVANTPDIAPENMSFDLPFGSLLVWFFGTRFSESRIGSSLIRLFHISRFGVNADLCYRAIVDSLKVELNAGGARGLDLGQRNMNLIVDQLKVAKIREVGALMKSCRDVIDNRQSLADTIHEKKATLTQQVTLVVNLAAISVCLLDHRLASRVDELVTEQWAQPVLAVLACLNAGAHTTMESFRRIGAAILTARDQELAAERASLDTTTKKFEDLLLRLHLNDPQRAREWNGKRVLVLEGGGLRGIITLHVLAKLEEITGRPVRDLFDVVSGTSVGGIIALALTVPTAIGRPMTASEALSLFSEANARRIFDQHGPGKLRGSAHSARGLETLLKETFGDARLSNALVPVVIPTLKIEPHGANEPVLMTKASHGDWYVWEVARATSAAPTFLPPFAKEEGAVVVDYLDGGVFENCPIDSVLAQCAVAPGIVVCVGTGITENYQKLPTVGLVDTAEFFSMLRGVWKKGFTMDFLTDGYVGRIFDLSSSACAAHAIRRAQTRYNVNNSKVVFHLQPLLRDPIELDDSTKVELLTDTAQDFVTQSADELAVIARKLTELL